VGDLVFRPLFTGDVLRRPGDELVMTVHHPCAMRRGADLVERVLVVGVAAAGSPPPKLWTGSYRAMFLPDLFGDGSDFVADLDDIDMMSPADIAASTRAVILSPVGVNLLMQRWINHTSRVVVPTPTINTMIAGQYDEADLVAEAVGELVSMGAGAAPAQAQVARWLDVPPAGEEALRRRLSDPQQRSTVRRTMRRLVNEWSPDLK
jgi:hypothetical protein